MYVHTPFPMVGIVGVHYVGGKVCSAYTGKTKLANAFIEYAEKHGKNYLHKNFGDAVKRELCNLLGITVTELEANKRAFRRLMQGYATDYVREHKGMPDHWVNALGSTMCAHYDLFKDPASFIVSDVRYPNEADFIRKNRGYIFRVELHSMTFPPGVTAADLDHSGEWLCETIHPDLVFTLSHTNQDYAGCARSGFEHIFGLQPD